MPVATPCQHLHRIPICKVSQSLYVVEIHSDFFTGLRRYLFNSELLPIHVKLHKIQFSIQPNDLLRI